MTPRSLGYVTLPLAVIGRRVRISLSAEGSTSAITKGTEVESQRNVDTGADRVSAASLSIIEAEFYEAASTRAPH